MTSLYIVHETPSSILPNGNSNDVRHETVTELKTARPSNAYFLYRAAKHEEITNFYKAAGQKIPFEREISKIITSWWKQENDGIRAHYKRQADIIAVEHQKEHPWYKYQPIQRKKKNQGAVKQTNRVTKKKTISPKSTKISRCSKRHEPFVEDNNDNEECLLPTALPTQCLSQEDLASLITSVDFHNIGLNLYNEYNTMNIDYQNLNQLNDCLFDFCI